MNFDHHLDTILDIANESNFDDFQRAIDGILFDSFFDTKLVWDELSSKKKYALLYGFFGNYFKKKLAFDKIRLNGQKSECELLLNKLFNNNAYDFFSDISVTGQVPVNRRIQSSLNRDKQIKQNHPKQLFSKLWYFCLRYQKYYQRLEFLFFFRLCIYSEKTKPLIFLKIPIERYFHFYKKQGFSLTERINPKSNLLYLLAKK